MNDIDAFEQSLKNAVMIHERGEVAEAELLYRQLLDRAPRYTAAWEHLGRACSDQGRLDEAVACFQQVITLDSRHASAYNNLGNAYRELRRLDHALASFDQALAIQPSLLPAYKNKAMALIWDGRVADGLATYEEALRHAPGDADTHNQIGQLRLLLGDFAGGWPEYEWRWKTGEMTLPSLDRPLWNGTPLYGQTILLVAEQGLGDSIQFVRYAAWLKQRYRCRVLFSCQPPLRQLISTCDGIDGWLNAPTDPVPYDVFAPLIHVPGVLAQSTHDFPSTNCYLSANPDLVDQWRSKLTPYRGRKIGVVWQGSPRLASAQVRNMPLPELARLARLPDVQLFSLQKGPGAGQVQQFPEIIDLGRVLDETTGAFVETAAVLKCLDLLITADTSVAHVAGALGVPVWVGLCNVPDWRWQLTGEKTVWYPTMRLFRQSSPGAWTDVIDRIADALLTSNFA